MKRRDFLKTGMAGIALLSLKTLGCSSSGSDNYVGYQFDLTIGAALFEMIDGKKVFMWTFFDPKVGPHMPGPVIMALVMLTDETAQGLEIDDVSSAQTAQLQRYAGQSAARRRACASA